MTEIAPTTPSPRARILAAAGALVRSGGRGAVSTRSVSAAAAVQPQTIYRQFGDMAGLLDAVATEGFAAYLDSKTSQPRGDDPVDDLRNGWDLHVGFGLDNPALYVLMYGGPDAGRDIHAADAAANILRDLVSAVARAGRLRVDVEDAAAMIHSAGVGVALSLIAQGPFRSPDLSVLQREAVLSAITRAPTPEHGGGEAEDTVRQRAISLRAVLSDAAEEFSAGELLLMDELLARAGNRRPSA